MHVARLLAGIAEVVGRDRVRRIEREALRIEPRREPEVAVLLGFDRGLEERIGVALVLAEGSRRWPSSSAR